MAKPAANLDLFLAEILGEGPKVTLFGRTWQLAPELPAVAMLQLRAIADGEIGDDTETFDTELALLRSVMSPPSQVDDLLAAGAGPSALAVLLRVVIGLYTGVPVEDTLAAMRAEQAAGGESPKG